MNEAASSTTPPRPNSGSPPPKCAICLGTCTNKCFSDSCMHQFCFTCLLEWSKVKAECPLCKQPFKSIIHNIKSNSEYDEHFIEVRGPEVRGILNNEDAFLYLPPAPSRHFQFRTTFTVDPGGELAIQQMLLSHPLTNSLYNVPGNYLLPRPSNRENPVARNRLVPWLNRELNALLRENTQQVMHLVDVIMDHLTRWHIRSRSFKSLLDPYLTNKTDHFIHEFYNFMRSPFDMIGYDRHIIYTERPYSPTYSISDQDDDSDVAIVNISQPVGADNNPFRRPTFEVIEINSDSSHDSDVIIREPPAAEVVVVDSDSSDLDGEIPEPMANNSISEQSEDSEVNRKPILPLKLRLKRKRQSKEKRTHSKCCSKHCHASSSSSSRSSSESISSEESLHKRNKKRRKHKKNKRNDKDNRATRIKEKSKIHIKFQPIFSDSSDEEPIITRKLDFDTDDNIPLSKVKTKEKKKKTKKGNASNNTSSKSHTVTSKNYSSTDENVSQNMFDSVDRLKPSCSHWKSSEIANISYETTTSSTPINLSLTSNSSCLPSISDEKYNFPNPEYELTTKPHLQNSKNIHLPNVEKEVHAHEYDYNSSRYNPAAIGSRYYDGPDYGMNVYRKSESYSPPPAHNALFDYSSSYNNVFYKKCSCGNGTICNNQCLYPTNHTVEIPVRVNVGVGTSPIKKEIAEQYSNGYSCAGPSNNRRLQSVIVKKEGKSNPRLFHPLHLNNDSTDSDS